MLQITGGEISYGRTVKTGDFENKRVDVKISFSVGEGVDHETVLAMAGNTAHQHCMSLLGMTALPSTVGGQTIEPQRTLAAPPKVDGRTKAAKQAQAAAPAKAEPAQDVLGDILGEAKPAPNADDDLLGDAATPTPEVTDEDLGAAITARNTKIKNAPEIKKLIASFCDPGLVNKTFRAIPKDRRQEFLAALEKVPAAK